MQKLLFLGLLLAAPGALFAQHPTDHELNELFWRYKNRYLHYFVNTDEKGDVGANFLPVSHRTNDWEPAEACVPGGQVSYGDATVDLGLYMAALALEYDNLVKSGGDTSGVLNEIYYTVMNFDRLDQNSSYFWNLTDSLDGFILRADANKFTLGFWQNQNINAISSVSYRKNVKENNCQEEGITLSADAGQDQLSYVLFGMFMLHHFVPNLYLHPANSQLGGIYLKNKIEEQTHRLMTFLFEPVDYYITKGCGTKKIRRNLFLINPTSHELVNQLNPDGMTFVGGGERGGDLLPLIYLFCLTAKKITGTDYMEWKFTYEEERCSSTETKSVQIKDLLQNPPSGIHGMNFLKVRMTPSDFELNFSSAFGLEQIQMNASIFFPHYAINGWFEFDENPDGSNMNEVAKHLRLEIYPLISAIIHGVRDNGPCSNSQEFWRNLLATAPRDINPHKYMDVGATHTAGVHSYTNFWGHSAPWNLNVRDWGDEPYLYFNGVHYLLTYNAYYHYYKAYSEQPHFNSCGCEHETPLPRNGHLADPRGWNIRDVWYNPVEVFPGHRWNDTVQTITTTHTINSYHESFDNLELASYRTLPGGKTYLIEDQARLIAATAVNLCNSSKFIIRTGGTLQIGTGTERGDFVVKQSELEMESGSSIVIKSGSRLTIKGGSHLALADANCRIVLEDRAELVIEGIILLGPTGKFKPEGSGKIVFKKGEYYTSNFRNIDVVSTLPGFMGSEINFTNITVEVGSDYYINPSDKILFNSNGTSYLLGTNAYLNIAGPAHFEHSAFRRSDRFSQASEKNVHKGLVLWGQRSSTKSTQGVSIIDCSFTDAKTGLKSLQRFGDQKSIRIISSSFGNCTRAIETYDHGAYLSGNAFSFCDHPWTVVNATGNLLFENNSFRLCRDQVVLSGNMSSVGIGGGNHFYKSGGLSVQSVELTLMCNHFDQSYTLYGLENSRINGNSKVFPSIMPGGQVLGGYNQFTDNIHSGYFVDNSIFDFNYGYNLFQHPLKTESLYSNTLGRGRIQSDYSFNQNKWVPKNQPAYVPYPVVNNLLAINHEGTTHFHFNSPTGQYSSMPIQGTTLGTIGGCPVSLWDRSGNNSSGTGGGSVQILISSLSSGGAILADLPLEKPTTTIKQGVFGGMKLADALKNSYSGVFKGYAEGQMEVDPRAIENIGSLMKSVDGTFNWTDAMTLTRLYSVALSNGLSNPAHRGFVPKESEAIQAISIMELRNQERTADVEDKRKNEVQLKLEKATLYYLYGNPGSSLTILNGIYNATPGEQLLIDSRKCYISASKSLSEGLIGQEDFLDTLVFCDSLRNAFSSARIGKLPILYTESDSLVLAESYIAELAGNEPQIDFLIYPNPASNLVSIRISNERDFSGTFKITDKFGVTRFQSGPFESAGGHYMKEVSLTGFVNDVYYLLFEIDGITYSRILIIG